MNGSEIDMEKLVYFMISDSLQNVIQPNNVSVPQLICPLLALRPQFIPSNFSFALTIGIQSVDLYTENKLKITFESPTGEILPNIGEFSLPKEQTKDHRLPTQYRGFVMSIDVRNFPFKIEGCYKFKVYFNDQLLSEQDMPVYIRDDAQ